jgi:cysteine desulfurase / selenocysteine lyase
MQEARKLFPALEERAYLIAGAVAPANTRSLEMMRTYLEIAARDPMGTYPGVPGAVVATEEVTELFAGLMHADADEIAITEGASAGSNIVVDLLRPVEGGNVVFDEFSYPSSICPWMIPPHDVVERRCVRAREGLIRLDDMAEAVDEQTIAISVCHVSPFEGFRHDLPSLADLAHAHGAVLIVDGSQTAGAMDVDLHASGVDFFVTTAMKWLLGTSGVGYLYVSRDNLYRRPTRAGYTSGGSYDIDQFDFVSTAQRFELGLPNLMGLAYSKPGLEILSEIGIAAIEQQVRDLAGYCISRMKERGLNVITPEDPEYRHGVIAAYLPEACELWLALRRQGIDVFAADLQTSHSARYGGDLFRVDPHFYNNYEDVDRFLEGVDDFFSKRQ